MATFSELLTEYMRRTGISDSELARSIGVQRQTIFRWKEGATTRPRIRDDVMRCAARLRLTPEERDLLLIAAGFAPESAPTHPDSTNTLQVVVVQSRDSSPSYTAPATPVLSPVQEESFPVAADATAKAGTQTDPERNSLHHHGWRWPIAGLLSAGLLLLLFFIISSRMLPERLTETPTPVTVTLNAPNVPIAIGGETLLLVAPFANFTQDQGYNIAGRIRDALRNAARDAGLEEAMVQVWPQVIETQRQATTALERSAGRLIIWGEFDSGRVQAMMLAAGDHEPTVWERQLGSPDDLPTTINVDAPREIALLVQSALGRLYAAEEKFDQAQTAFGRAIDMQPVERATLANLYFYSGLAHERMTPPNWEQAIAAYSQTLTLQPEWVNAFYNRGRAHLMAARLTPLHSPDEARHLARAIDDLTATLNARPGYWEAYLNRGSAYYERNGEDDLQKALDDYSQAARLADESHLPHLALGLALIRAGDPGWRSEIERAASLAPQQPEVEQALCWGALTEFAAADGLLHCQAAIALADEPDAYRDLSGLVYAQLGEMETAQAELSAYLAWVKRQPAEQFERLSGDKVEAMVAALAAGENPVTRTTIEALRKGE
jgi:tetratricopeptide (TPR) repeat protein